MKNIILTSAFLIILISCTQRDYLKEDKWVEYELVKPKVTVKLPESFRFITEYPADSDIYTDTTTVFLWPKDPYIAVSVNHQYDDFDKWFINEKRKVAEQNRKIWLTKENLGEFDYNILTYSKFDKKDTSTYIGYAFVNIDGVLFDIHNVLENKDYFRKFLKSIKSQ